MTPELIQRLAGLSLIGYYDPSLKLVCVHFYQTNSDKKDMIAYLQPNSYWDLREIDGEHTQLFDDHEEVHIRHNKVGLFEHGSKFDEFLRGMLANQLKNQTLGKDEALERVLQNGYST
jgi:hypothetical protein